MSYSRKINTQINKLHELRLGLVYDAKRSPFCELLKRDDTITIHEKKYSNTINKNIQSKNRNCTRNNDIHFQIQRQFI